MKIVDDFLSLVLDVFEAAGCRLRRRLLKVYASLFILMVAGTLLSVGVIFIAAAVFLALRRPLGPVGSLLVVGAMVLGLAGALWWKAITLTNLRK